MKAKGKKCRNVKEMSEYILDVMDKGDEKLGVNDAFSFIDWLRDYLNDIVYGD